MRTRKAIKKNTPDGLPGNRARHFTAWLAGLVLLLAAPLYGQNHKPAQKKDHKAPPNFILILADDYGWTSLSTAMNKYMPDAKSDFYETPHIDQLAASGMRFSRGYAPAAICTPSRRSILYGQSPPRQGDEDGFASRYHPDNHDYLTIPLMLKKANDGYRAAHFGKWHLQGDFFPEEVGYDESDGKTRNADGNMMEDKSQKWVKTFLTGDPKKVDHITERGMNFMKRCTNAGHPFYLQLSHYATHVDIQSTEKAHEKFSGKEKGKVHSHPGYAGMLEHLDEGVGKIMAYVEELGIAENTYIIFMADNGGVTFIPPPKNKLSPPASFQRKENNYPLRGGKWVLYEGGIRVPFIMKGPGIDPGTQCDVPVIGYDLLPTMADLAGYRKALSAVDGGSLRGLLEKRKGRVRRPAEALVFHRYSGYYPHSAIILGDYKLLKFWRDMDWRKKGVELYNLKDDPGETKDLSEQMPEKVAALEQEMTDYFKKVNPELFHQFAGKIK